MSDFSGGQKTILLFGRYVIIQQTDGSKVGANASINSSWTKDRCLRRLEKIDNRIKGLADNEILKAKVVAILNKLNAEG